jgi:hypothetical protein
MDIRLHLNPETEARLVAEARVQGLPLEKVAENLLTDALTGRISPDGHMTREELHQMLAGMARYSDRLPDLPTESFSRESFYEDGVDDGDDVPRR